MRQTNNSIELGKFNSEIQVIKKAIKDTKDLRLYQRYMVILYHLEGYYNYQIAERVFLCQHTVGTYIRKYKKSGITGLALGHSPGAPRMLTKEQEEILVEIITTKMPAEVGFSSKCNWTIAIIKQWVSNTFSIEISHSGMAEILNRLRLSYTRPTYVLANADPAKQEAYKQEFEVLKKTN